jgi:hypothetical protein
MYTYIYIYIYVIYLDRVLPILHRGSEESVCMLITLSLVILAIAGMFLYRSICLVRIVSPDDDV